jgi:hypothetical protein
LHSGWQGGWQLLTTMKGNRTKLLQLLYSFEQVENGLHYPRDVTYRKDQTRRRNHSAVHVLAIINNLVLGLIANSDFHFILLPEASSPLIQAKHLHSTFKKVLNFNTIFKL